MFSTQSGTSRRSTRRARIAAAVAVLAISAFGIGAASSGASAANGWGRYVSTTVPPVTAAPSDASTTAPRLTATFAPTGGGTSGAYTNSANGWG
jgi:hypothetical protein